MQDIWWFQNNYGPHVNTEAIRILEEYQVLRDALVKLDELSLMLGQTLQHTRVGWDDTVTCEGVLSPINDIAKQIGDAVPASIKATRPNKSLVRNA